MSTLPYNAKNEVHLMRLIFIKLRKGEKVKPSLIKWANAQRIKRNGNMSGRREPRTPNALDGAKTLRHIKRSAESAEAQRNRLHESRTKTRYKVVDGTVVSYKRTRRAPLPLVRVRTTSREHQRIKYARSILYEWVCGLKNAGCSKKEALDAFIEHHPRRAERLGFIRDTRALNYELRRSIRLLNKAWREGAV